MRIASIERLCNHLFPSFYPALISLFCSLLTYLFSVKKLRVFCPLGEKGTLIKRKKDNKHDNNGFYSLIRM